MTGPEGQAYHCETAVVVHDLYRRAECSILVAGYAMYQGKEIFEELGRRMREVCSLQARVFLNITRRTEDTAQEPALVAAFVNRFKKYQWPERPATRNLL